MLNHIDCEFAESNVAEAPLVIAYIVALIFFAFAWSNFSPPATSITDLTLGSGNRLEELL